MSAATAPVRRLLSDLQAAEYLNISRGLLRRYIVQGIVKRVELPSADGRHRARLLRIDRADLDLLIVDLKRGTP